ncbi:MAG: cation diffusion facilitator family transporter [Bacillota bacterium]|jgi:cation diffusion facilitator family transporter
MEEARVRRFRDIKRVLWIVMGLNLLVAVAKLVVGTLARSAAMVADGYHSLSDGSGNLVGLVGVGLASKPVDDDHPYGHGKYETLTALGIGVMLFTVAFSVFRTTWQRYQHPVAVTVEPLQFAVMLGTMAINLLVTRFERRQGQRLQSEILMSDAAHTATDLYVSGTVIISLLAVRLGFPLIDLLASVAIGLLIVKAGWGIMAEGFKVLTDSAILDPEEVTRAALEVPGVVSCHQIRSRGRADQAFLDIHVQVADNLDLEQTHILAHRVEGHLQQRFPNLQDAAVHVEPVKPQR